MKVMEEPRDEVNVNDRGPSAATTSHLIPLLSSAPFHTASHTPLTVQLYYPTQQCKFTTFCNLFTLTSPPTRSTSPNTPPPTPPPAFHI
ncbi:hypothetical protein E2C01_073118 [Portunus trituberculatus]|uniref:Uncharacterized protein n=1 Tax=Portunus trituberculatus TaxID=210409 RepID=A0A5B7I9R4_PORTR|nr:hypothetical protein [Portunus trituberculatus]